MPRGECADHRAGWRVNRLVLLTGGVIALALVFGIGWMLMRAFTATPRPIPDVSARVGEVIKQTRARLALDDKPDRWPDLLRTIEEVRSVGERLPADSVHGLKGPDFSIVSDPRPESDRLTEAQREEITRKALAGRDLLEREGTLERLWSLAGAERFERVVSTDPNASIDHLSPCRQAARFLRMDMVVAADAGDMDRAVKSFEAALAIARALSQQPSVIDQLTGVAIHMLALGGAADIAARIALTEDQAKAWIAAIDRQPPSTAGMVGAARVDRLEQEASLATYYTTRGTLIVSAAEEALRKNGKMAALFTGEETSRGTIGRVLESPAGNVAGGLYPDWDESLAAIDRYYGAAEIVLSHARGEPERGNVDDIEALKKLHDEVSVTLVTAPFGISNFVDSRRTQREATKIMFAIAACEARHARLPQTLAELAPDFLAAVPRDPMTGGAWGYKRHASIVDGRPYVLYSFWVDGEDNGGVGAHPDGETPPMGNTKGFDYVYNRRLPQ